MDSINFSEEILSNKFFELTSELYSAIEEFADRTKGESYIDNISVYESYKELSSVASTDDISCIFFIVSGRNIEDVIIDNIDSLKPERFLDLDTLTSNFDNCSNGLPILEEEKIFNKGLQ